MATDVSMFHVRKPRNGDSALVAIESSLMTLEPTGADHLGCDVFAVHKFQTCNMCRMVNTFPKSACNMDAHLKE